MTSSRKPDLPDISDIETAAKRLLGVAVRTPLLESTLLNRETGGRILIKPEMLQPAGSFKFRGAYNRIAMIDPDTRACGVVAYSSGNHAQGVAKAASLFGIPAVIIMPSDAPKAKIEGTRALGAEILFYDRASENRETIGETLARDRGLTLVRPYDDAEVIAGQGTIGLEIVEDLARMNLAADAVLAPCGGGGLVAGIARVVSERCPNTQVFAVEPVGFDDTARSLAAGERLENAIGGQSLCDALMAPTPGALTFDINRRLLAGGLAVDEGDTLRAMRVYFERFRLVAEPGGAVALAAVLTKKIPVRGRTLVVIASGGNVDPDVYAHAFAEAGT